MHVAHLNRLLAVLVLLSTLQSGTYRGVAYPELTTEQMFEDFDYLVNVVEHVFPAIVANRKVYGIDVFENLAFYRAKIPEVKTTLDFVWLVNQAINSCKGSHFWISPITLDEYKSSLYMQTYYKGYVDENALTIHEGYIDYLSLRNADFDLNVPLLYFEGNYYTKHDFVYGGVRYRKGLKLVSANGQSPDDVVRSIEHNHRVLPWDSQNGKFYSPWFYKDRSTAKDGCISFQFADNGGDTITVTFEADEIVDCQRTEFENLKRVEFLPESRILYVGLPSMSLRDLRFYISEIRSRGEGKDIRAVIIDIRNNAGGNDVVWRQIVGHLSGRKHQQDLKVGIKASDLNLAYLRQDPYYGEDIAQDCRPEQIPFLDDEEFLTVRLTNEIEPEERSIGYDGVIYVLSEGVYSAAGNLLTFAKETDSITSVGVRNAYVSGVGINPYAFTLPNSKLIFNIEPLIDLTGAEDAEGVFHNDVEAEITPTLEGLLHYYNCDDDRPLEDFLADCDPFFEKVQELLE
jgi:hypothetical protein